MAKVSVFIPIYGVEEYIEKCSRSLFEQTLNDIEYIFINDCTKDKSIEVLESVIKDYPNRQNQVAIINMPQNSGQALVCRKGAEIATGDFLIKCDGDDWVDHTMYEKMYQAAVDNNADMVICDLMYDAEKGTVWEQKPTKGSDLLSDMILSNNTVSMCNKLVRRAAIPWNEFIWPQHNMGEDFVFSIQYGYHCKKIARIHEPLYYYFRREDSISGNVEKGHVLRKLEDFRSNFYLAISFLKKKEVIRMYSEEIAHRSLNLKNSFLPFFSDKGIWKEWHSMCSFSNFSILTSKYITKKEKLVYVCTYLGIYSLYRRVHHSLS